MKIHFTVDQIIKTFESKEISCYRLAKIMNSDASNVSKQIKKMKNGGSVTTKTIEKYARALGLFDEQ